MPLLMGFLSSIKNFHAKLKTLEESMLSRYSHNPVTDTLSDETLCEFIRLDSGREEYELQLVESIDSQNTSLTVIRARNVHEVRSLSSSVAEHDDPSEALAAARQARDFNKSSSKLFDLLSANMGYCGSGHIANTYLSGFGAHEQNMEISLSTCLNTAQKPGWHPATCSEQRYMPIILMFQ